MSWHDPDRSSESAEDAALREELRALLGVRAPFTFELEPTAESRSLADALRREARRRNHLASRKHSWLLMAAALPLALVAAGLGTWGIAQKQRADALSAAVVKHEAEIQRLAASLKAAPPVAAPALRTAPAGDHQLASAVQPQPKRRGKELVQPVDTRQDRLPAGTQVVKEP